MVELQQEKPPFAAQHLSFSPTAMAGGSVTALQQAQFPAVVPELGSLTEGERRQVDECQRILQFRDRVLSGSHPSIRVLPHLFAPKQSTESRSSASASASASAFASTANQVPAGQGRNVSAPAKPPPKGPKLSRANATMPAKTKGNGSQVAANLRSFTINAAHSDPARHNTAFHPPGLDSASGSLSTMAGIPTGPKADAAKRASGGTLANVQFDPVLLTKSEDLIKAESQLQRQRLERVLAEQLQQHRAAAKAASTIEAPVDFDLAAVLMKALQLAQSSALQQADANLAANPSGSENDSNDTFYSSKHDTPESHLDQRIPGSDDADAAQDREDSPYEPPMVMDASSIPGQVPSAVAVPSFTTNSHVPAHATTQQSSNVFAQPPGPFPQPLGSFSNAPTHNHTIHTSYQPRNNAFGGNNSAQEANGGPIEITSSQDSGEGSSSRDSGVGVGVTGRPSAHLAAATSHIIEQAFGRHQSPILRAHNLSPVAPQPAHISPLATSRQPPLPQQDAPPAQATSAQIAALRADQSNGSSPDSSPQGKAGKKGKKNKKRKADRMAVNNAPAPHIKAEPRSPSPMTAPQYPRQVNKRMRPAQHQRQEQGADGLRLEEIVESAHPSSHTPRFHRDDRGPPYGNGNPGLPSFYRDGRGAAYGDPAAPAPRQEAVVITSPPTHEREYREEFRPVETIRYIRRGSPGAQPYPLPNPPGEVRTHGSVSHAAIDRPYPYYDTRGPSRTVMRPAVDRERSRSPILVEERALSAMGPPQLPPSRVVIDEFGREYIEPPSRQEPVVIRRSVAHRSVYGDREEVYEPSRASSRIIRRSVAPSSVHGEPDIVYERTPTARAASVAPGPGRYDEEVVYHAPASQAGYSPVGYSPAGYSSAGYTATRRVVARPEYPPEYPPEYRYYRERDYPPQPPVQHQLGGDYYEVRESRPPRPEPQRVVRYTSVRPESPTRAEVVRMSSIRPDGPIAGEYLQNMPPPRAYSVRPMGPPPLPQQDQYERQWAEYEARPEYGSRPAYGEQVPVEEDSVTHVEGASRELYR